MILPYNPEDKQSIVDYAKNLTNKTLREVCDVDLIKNDRKGKGHFGQILEEFYFQYKPNSTFGPDFPNALLELKTSPLKKLKNKEFRSKERLVLNIINYLEVVNQDFNTSSFWKKNANILLVFYLHVKNADILDYLIKLVDEWSFPETDLEIIKKDWEFIQQKIASGKAHELSEGDTFYLGACTKGSNSKSTRKQPNSKILAKQRAFSLKQGYVNHIIASISQDSNGKYGKLISTVDKVKKHTIEEIVLGKFYPYYNKSIDEIISTTGVVLNKDAKNFYANLTNVILGIELGKEIEEFKKAEIIVKSVRVESNNTIVESISFKNFKYIELVKEKWDDSEFKDILEHKFLFIFFKDIDGQRVLQKAKFWNMPYKHIQMAKKVWTDTKRIIITGNIVKNIEPNGKRETNFMHKKDNTVSHVRPHAKNAADTNILPTKDKVTGAMEYTKHCFWLNNNYVKNEIYLK